MDFHTEPVEFCPMCGDSSGEHFFSAPDRLHAIPGIFSYCRCGVCRTVFQNPRIVRSEQHRAYPDDYFTHSAVDDKFYPARQAGRLRDRIRKEIARAVLQDSSATFLGKILATLRPLRERAFFGLRDPMIPTRSPAGRALEIGCGRGELVRILNESGWKTEGIEWDPAAAEVARRATGVIIHTGDFRQLDLPSEVYALITMNHVFEHLDEPVDALRRIAALLEPGGRAVLVFPNPGSVGSRVYSSWCGWDPPRHLVIPSNRSIAAALLRAHCGLTAERIFTASRMALPFLCMSRQLSRGKAKLGVRASASDRAMAMLESILAGMGFFVGEETVVVLRKNTGGKTDN